MANRVDGTIHNREDLFKKLGIPKTTLQQEEALLRGKGFMSMEVPPTEEQMQREPPKVELDDPCPCGSGKTFQQCCHMDKPCP